MATQQANNELVSAAQSYATALQKNLEADSTQIAARVFRSSLLSMRYVFKNGKVAPFMTKNGIDSEYTTDIKHEIEELDGEIRFRHPNLSSKPEELVSKIEPMAALREKHFKEFMEMQAKAVSLDNNAGYSEQGKLNVANSRSIAEAAMGNGAPTGSGVKINLGMTKN